MSKNTRLETILKVLLRQKTGSLEPPATTFNDRVENLAYHLAEQGVIVLLGELDPTHRAQWGTHVRLWMSIYAELYYLLNYGLYDATDTPVAYMADQKYPIVVVFEAETLVVVRVLTNLIIPYVALRQSADMVSRAELRGIVDTMLDELGASNIDIEKKNFIRAKAIEHLYNLLRMEIKQASLTNFSQAFMIEMGMTQSQVSATKRPDNIPGLADQRASTQEAREVRKASPSNIIPLPPLPKPKRKPDGGGDDDGLVGLLNRYRG